MNHTTNNINNCTVCELSLEAFEIFATEIEKPPKIAPAIAKLLTHQAPWQTNPIELNTP